MECKEIAELITAAVDKSLDENEQQQVDAHILKCPRCKQSFAIERITRDFVRQRCKRLPVPDHVLQRISRQLAAEDRVQPHASWWQQIAGSIYVKPAVAFATACIAIILLVNRSDGPSTVIEASILPPNDIIKQSLMNYSAVESGQIKPQFISARMESLQAFFDGKTEFPVVLPKMHGCRLVGGVLNEFLGDKLAHLVYNHHDTAVVYIYETCWEKVQQGSPMHLAADIQDELRTKGWYAATKDDGFTVAMWINGRTLCSAVARLDKETLLACIGGTDR